MRCPSVTRASPLVRPRARNMQMQQSAQAYAPRSTACLPTCRPRSSRIFTYLAPLTRPQDLAWLLASYARDALRRVEASADLPALQTIRSGLEQALGLRFENVKGEHFLRSTLVQTIFYGIFSAWVQWSKDGHRGEQFDWHAAVGHYAYRWSERYLSKSPPRRAWGRWDWSRYWIGPGRR